MKAVHYSKHGQSKDPEIFLNSDNKTDDDKHLPKKIYKIYYKSWQTYTSSMYMNGQKVLG